MYQTLHVFSYALCFTTNITTTTPWNTYWTIITGQSIVLCVLHRSSHLSSQQRYVLNTFYPYFLDTEIGINNWLKSLPQGHTESKWRNWDYDPGSLHLEFQSLAHDFI